MASLWKLLWLFALLGVLTALKEMTMEEKRVENAMFVMAGEEPPNDVPLNHYDQTFHDMLVTSVEAVRESHIGRPANSSQLEPASIEPDIVDNVQKMNSERVRQFDAPPMQLWFHFGYKEKILFEFWKTTDIAGFIISFVIIFSMGVIYELLKWYRVYLVMFKKFKRKESFHLPTIVTVTDGRALKEDFKCSNVNSPLVNNSKNGSPTADRNFRPSPLSLVRLIQAIVYAIQLGLAYSLMLIVMTFNVWLALAVVLGAVFGNWIVISFCSATKTEQAASSDADH